MSGIPKVKLSEVLKETVLPVFLSAYFSNGDGQALQEELRSYITTKGERSAEASLDDYYEVNKLRTVESGFDGLIMIASNLDIVGLEECREDFLGRVFETRNELEGNPILGAGDGISKEVYRDYARYSVKGLCLNLTTEIFETLFLSFPEEDCDFYHKPLGELGLCVGMVDSRLSGEDISTIIRFESSNVN